MPFLFIFLPQSNSAHVCRTAGDCDDDSGKFRLGLEEHGNNFFSAIIDLLRIALHVLQSSLRMTFFFIFINRFTSPSNPPDRIIIINPN